MGAIVRRIFVVGLGLVSGLLVAQAPTNRTTPANPAIPIDVWTLSADLTPGTPYFGETVANGMLGILSTPDPFSNAGVMMQGVYDRRPDSDVDVILRSFNVVALGLAIDHDNITHAQQVSHLHQALNLKNGALTTTFDYQDKATVTYTWYALRQLPYVALADVTVTAKQPIDITGTVSPEAPPGVGGVPYRFGGPQTGVNDLQYSDGRFSSPRASSMPFPMITATAHTGSGRLLLAASHTFLFDTAAENANVQTIVTATGAHAITFSRHLKPGVSYHFVAVGSTITSLQQANPKNEAERLTMLAALLGRDELLAQHDRAWQQLWRSDIAVEGDPQTQRDIHAMLYHLYAFVREGNAVALSPMGLSGTGYNGHVFWDTETWMYPVLLAMHPEIARSLLEYRFERLDSARRNAAINGYRGAMFPWESSATGDEDTPLCCLTGVIEQHVTADIGIAAWNYYRATQDREWLRTRGYPMLEATADFWTSRVNRKNPNVYSIDHVVAADEYGRDIDDNAFTNAAARANLAAATSAARVLGLTPRAQWEEVRRKIPILKFPNGTTREYAGYEGEQIKQADVNLLAYPLKEITDPAAIKRDLEYYSERVDQVNGPAMTKSVLAILHERLGETDTAYRLFQSGYTLNVRPPFGVIAETATSNNPYFVTGVGGLLQTMLYGFGGLDLTDRGFIQKRSKLPAAWKSLTLTGVGPSHQTYKVAASR